MPRSRNEIPTPEHLEWMIEGRGKNQSTALKLYELFQHDATTLKGFSFRLQELAGVAFSLWRAVFFG